MDNKTLEFLREQYPPGTRVELNALKWYLTSQASDGLGEGFEQQDLRTEEGILNIHLWGHEDRSIQTEEERFGELEQRFREAPMEPQF